MGKKRLMKLIITASAIAGGIGFSGNVASAAENNVDRETTAELSKSFKESNESVKGVIINVNSSLRVRSSASLESEVIGSLQKGQEISILAEEGTWYKIDFNGKEAYVSKDYVQKKDSDIKAQNEAAATISKERSVSQGIVVNVTNMLNVRSGAGTSYGVIGTLRNGDTFKILGKSGDWYNIQKDGITGYVSGQYVKETSGNSSEGNSSGAEQGESGQGRVINVTNSLNVRSGAGTNHGVVGTLRNGDTFTIIGKSGSWYHIQKDGVTGYVSGEYVQEISGGTSTEAPSTEGTSSPYGQVINITTNLRVRVSPSASANVLGYLRNNQVVEVKGTTGDWVNIDFNGRNGYVSSEYIRFTDSNSGTGNGSTNGADATAIYTAALNAMKAHLGSPYVWGGSGEYLTTSSLNALKNTYPVQTAAGSYRRAEGYVDQGYRAFDCSGLMQWGYRQAGISIGRSTWDQINNGVEVPLNDLKPGDLLFYSNLQHVGMYIGNGQWIEAPNSSANVRIVSVPWSKIGRARRVI